MKRVVADTNILISAVMFGGLPGRLLDAAFRGRFLLVTSPVLLDELTERLLHKFQLAEADVAAIRHRLEVAAMVVTPAVSVCVVVDDPDDDRVIECAVAADADLIVSGDKHLLRLGVYKRTAIVTARQLMDEMSA